MHTQKVQITNHININHLHIGNNDNSVNIHNQGLPDWIEADKIGDHVDQVRKAVALLEANGVKGLAETDKYIRKEVFTYSDFVKALKDDFSAIDRVVELTKRTVPQKAAKIAPLTLAYNFIFNNKKGSELETLHRRPFHLYNDEETCDVLAYKNDSSADCVLGWEKKIWRSLLSEILHMLGIGLYERMKHANHSYISSSEDEDEAPEPEEPTTTYYETDEQAQRAEMKIKRERHLQELRNKKKMKARMHPYIKWWTTVVGPETLEFDPDVCRLMDTISKELIKQCKNDVRAGWHRLIDYCRALHEIGQIEIQQSPTSNELDDEWKKYGDLQKARREVENTDDEEEMEENNRQMDHHWKRIQKLRRSGMKTTKTHIDKKYKHQAALTA